MESKEIVFDSQDFKFYLQSSDGRRIELELEPTEGEVHEDMKGQRWVWLKGKWVRTEIFKPTLR